MNPADTLAARFPASFIWGRGGFGSYNSCLLFIHVAAMKRRQKFLVFHASFSEEPAFLKVLLSAPPKRIHTTLIKFYQEEAELRGFSFPPSFITPPSRETFRSEPSRKKKSHPTPTAYSPVLFFDFFFSLTTPSSPSACVTVCQPPSPRFIPLTHISDVSLTKCDRHRAPAEGERD